MAGGAEHLELALAGAGEVGRGLLAGQLQHVGNDFLDALWAQRVAPGGHHAHAPDGDGGVDIGFGAAPLPVGIGEVGEADGAARVRAVAHGAVVRVQVAGDPHRVRVGLQLVGAHGREAGKQRGRGALRRVDLLLPLAFLRPAERALPAAEAGEEDQVAEAEDHSAVEQPQPPARQRVVVLGEVAVPGMASGLDGRAGLLARGAPGGRPHQPQRAEDVDRRDDHDEQGPA